MKWITTIYPLLASLCLYAQSEQNSSHVLSGTFIKKTVPTRNVKSYPSSKFFYGNISFQINTNSHPRFSILNDSTSEIDKLINDSTYKALLSSIPEKQPKLKDCIYFNPTKSYVTQAKPSHLFYHTEKSLFTLKNLSNFSFTGQELIFPNSLRFYINPNHIQVLPNQTALALDSNFQLKNDLQLLYPFHFRKYEVSNKEYREFIESVKDSIIKTELIKRGYSDYGFLEVINRSDTIFHINEKKSLSKDDYKPLLPDFFIFDDSRFYSKSYFKSEKITYKKGSESISIYPDTLVWVNDFIYSFLDPYTNLYFWHPAYDDYPVVGVNFYQAKAYLHWKSRKHQRKLDDKGIKLLVKYKLPNDFQWDLASTAEINKKDEIECFTENYHYLSDNSWITDLKLTNDELIRDSISSDNTVHKFYRSTHLFQFIRLNGHLPNHLIKDGFLTTTKCDINVISREKRKNPLINQYVDATGIHQLSSNVSEWIENDYNTEWKPLFKLRQKQLRYTKEGRLVSNIERWFNQFNDSTGKLVRGGNWFDERYKRVFGKNIEGQNLKRFIDPNKSHSTLGFRYIVEFKKSD